MKQAWYRVCERLYLGQSSKMINLTYSHTLPRIPVTGPTIDFWQATLKQFDPELSELRKHDLSDSWHFKSIEEMFVKAGCRNFMNLDIWHIKELRLLYEKMTGKPPIPSAGSILIEKYIDRFRHLVYAKKKFLR